MGRHVRLDVDGPTGLLTLARPEVRNAITGAEMLGELTGTLTSPPDGMRVLVITGEGSAFSAGGNVAEMAERGGMFAGSGDDIAHAYRTTIQRLTRALAHSDLVTIAAVNGPAVGAGFDLALGCDLRLASTAAWFAHTFVDLGIIPGDGGAWLLPRVVGWQRAAELALTARKVDAEEAARLDIVLEVVAPEDLLERARRLAGVIASKPAHSVRMTKQLLRHARTMDLDGFLDYSAALQAIAHGEPEHEASVRRYLEELRARRPSGDEGT